MLVLSIAFAASTNPLAQDARAEALTQAIVRRLDARIEAEIPSEGRGYLLDRVGGIVPIGDGELAILSWGERTVRVLASATGRLTRSFGAPGAGPGEFKNPTAMGRVGDLIWVWDPSVSRITVFSTAGELVRTIPVAERGHAVLLKDGAVGIYRARGFGTRLTREDTLTIRRQEPSGAVKAVFSTPAPYRVLSYPSQTGQVIGAQPFDDNVLIAPSLAGGGFVIVERGASQTRGVTTTRITKLGINGEAMWARQLTFPTVRLSDKEVQRAISRLLPPARGQAPVDPNLTHRIRDALFVPAMMTPVSGILSGLDGSTWLRREERATSDSVMWMRLNPNGEADIEVRLHQRFALYLAVGDSLIGLLQADDQPPRILVLRLGRRS